MDIDQKIGQIIQLTFNGITEKGVTDPQEALKYYLGSLLIGGNAAPTPDGNMASLASYLEEERNKQIYMNASAANWKKLTDKFKDIGVSVTTKDNKKYLIKLLMGTDAVHGDQHSVGNVVFPHNIGLSCSHNAGNFENLGFWTKEGVKRSGFNFVFAPCVAVSHNPQWGRTYETMGQ
jgi:beta-glucosidase